MSSCSQATVILIRLRLNLGRSLELEVEFGSRSALELELGLEQQLEPELKLGCRLDCTATLFCGGEEPLPARGDG